MLTEEDYLEEKVVLAEGSMIFSHKGSGFIGWATILFKVGIISGERFYFGLTGTLVRFERRFARRLRVHLRLGTSYSYIAFGGLTFITHM